MRYTLIARNDDSVLFNDALSTHLYAIPIIRMISLRYTLIARNDESVLFNDALNTFISIYIRRIIEIIGSKKG